jgi:transcription initiation factor TFIID subunit 5
LSSLLPRNRNNLQNFNSSNPITLKLGPPPITDKLKEQVTRTLRDESAAEIDGDGDVNMDEPSVKIEQVEVVNGDSDLLSPGEGETNPPVPAVFRIADLKREVEAVRDKRKMIRLGPGVVEGKQGPGNVILPSIIAFTMLDGGEG